LCNWLYPINKPVIGVQDRWYQIWLN
jgi:hypothetical protein